MTDDKYRIELKKGDGAKTSITLEEAAQLCGMKIENLDNGRILLRSVSTSSISFIGTKGQLVDYFQFQARQPARDRR